MNGIGKRTTTKAKEIIKQINRRVGEETGELIKHAESQVTGSVDVHPKSRDVDGGSTISPVIETIKQTLQPSLASEEKMKRRRAFVERVKKNEEELKKAQLEAKKKLEAWGENAISAMKIVSPGESMEKSLEIPKSKPSRGKTPGVPGTEPGIEIRKSKQ